MGSNIIRSIADSTHLQLQDHQVSFAKSLEKPDISWHFACRGDIPSFKLVDTEKTYAFLDIGPLSKGHALVIPKCSCIE